MDMRPLRPVFVFLCTLIYQLFYLSLINCCWFRFLLKNIQSEISSWTSSWHTVINKLTLLKDTYKTVLLFDELFWLIDFQKSPS